MTDLKDYYFTHELTSLHEKQLLELYRNEWWAEDRSKEDVEAILQGCSFIVGLVDKTTENLIGFARILTDYFKFAYIHDVMVEKNYRGKGLGKHIMDYIVQHEKLKNIQYLELTCKEDMMSFYKKFDFSKDFDIVIPMRRMKKVMAPAL